MITCYIIDDEMHAIEALRNYIEQTPGFTLIGFSENPINALSEFQEANVYADIVFLDIDMPGISGIEVSGFLQGKTNIIFTTAFANFALEAFELDARDYLLKPFPYERFLKSIYKVKARLQQQGLPKTASNSIFIQTEGKGKMVKINIGDIIYIESLKNYISIYSASKKWLTYLTLSEIQEKLPARFFRIHKSYVINTDKISHIEGYQIFLENKKDSLPVGISYRDDFFEYVKVHLIRTKRSL